MTLRRASAPAAFLAAALLVLLALPAAAAAATAPPPVTARSAIVIEPSSGDVSSLAGPHRRRPIASTTKLMTAYVALQEVGLSDVFTAPRYKAGPFETKIGLRKGERMKVSDLLRAMLLPSANDAAATVAVGVAGSRKAFVADMNRHAAESWACATPTTRTRSASTSRATTRPRATSRASRSGCAPPPSRARR